jgi:hypothetical protein
MFTMKTAAIGQVQGSLLFPYQLCTQWTPCMCLLFLFGMYTDTAPNFLKLIFTSLTSSSNNTYTLYSNLPKYPPPPILTPNLTPSRIGSRISEGGWKGHVHNYYIKTIPMFVMGPRTPQPPGSDPAPTSHHRRRHHTTPPFDFMCVCHMHKHTRTYIPALVLAITWAVFSRSCLPENGFSNVLTSSYKRFCIWEQ